MHYVFYESSTNYLLYLNTWRKPSVLSMARKTAWYSEILKTKRWRVLQFGHYNLNIFFKLFHANSGTQAQHSRPSPEWVLIDRNGTFVLVEAVGGGLTLCHYAVKRKSHWAMWMSCLPSNVPIWLRQDPREKYENHSKGLVSPLSLVC